jgi:outer membrane protein assembly factor BamB
MRILILLSLLVSSAVAENWPQWRGPLGTGISTEKGLPTEWSTKQNLAWQTELTGLGVSSPIVWKDQVFVTYQLGAGALRQGRHPTFVQEGDPASAGETPLGGARPKGPDEKISFVIAAFRTADGRQVWEHRIDAVGKLPDVHDKRNLATSSAVTDGERVYAWFSNGQLAAVDLNGKAVWARHLGQEYAPFDLDWGHASSPALYRDRLILTCYEGSAAFLLALDKRTGKELWKVERPREVKSYSTPLVTETAQGPEVIVNSTESIEAFDPSTGKSLWRFLEPARFAVPMPVYHDGIFYVSRGYRSGPYWALKAGERDDVPKSKLLWHVETGAPYTSSILHHDGLLYMATEMGIVTCIDARTGERVWRERLGGIYSASPVLADGKIYLASENGETLVLRAGRTPQVLARNKLDMRVIASPAIAEGRIFMRGDRQLVAIRTGSAAGSNTKAARQ